ncbi:hypothetical protein G7Y89_g14300 [Cudoniella acicularis]|uniref:Clr5 domain-containing protein n=1 Tax=Cudoniella acicularis TaxID=354080 RepID=A0A8H4R5E5_9HELO|nr:hypothetical protein G7Y89_g14300 [Cudoniella acicularis]
MSTPRPQKWDWTPHQAKMVELYKTQMSIPDIFKAIQCEGFEPCQRSVYLKFKSMGFPTDPVGRQKLLDATDPSNTPSNNQNIFNASNNTPSSTFPSHSYLQSSLSPLPEDPMMMEPSNTGTWDYGYAVDAQPSDLSFGHSDAIGGLQMGNHQLGSGAFYHDSSIGSPTDAHMLKSSVAPEPNTSIWTSFDGANQNFSPSTNTFDQSYDFPGSTMELNGAAYFGIDTGNFDSQGDLSAAPHDQNVPDSKGSSHGWQQEFHALGSESFPANFPGMELDHDSIFSHDENIEPVRRKNSLIDLKNPFQTFINASNNTGTRSKFRSLFNKKSNGSFRSKKKYAASQYTHNTSDSGYASGFGSCLTLEEVQQINSQSMKEFSGMYRVACHVPHEPLRKAQYKDITTCTQCRYSSIHNLGWSSRYLKLEVFLSELKLEGVYDIGALDAAGNTALHYAAAGGAGFLHLKALIDAGVNPYITNTAGELFIHCLRPLQPFTLEPNSDCLKSRDLVNLLELLDSERIFGSRDNDGQTVLHALALKISEPELKAQIFKMFIDAGYPPTVPDRFGRTAADVRPLTYDCHGQVIDPTPFPRSSQDMGSASQNKHMDEVMTSETMSVDEWRQQNVEQIRAQTVVVEARRQSNCVDPETGDNVIHALSRLKASNDVLLHLDQFNSKEINRNLHNREGNYILLNLQHFIPRGVDLNLHNRKGVHPLKSFICDRPCEEAETGATMSKYLDAILWKDHKGRVSNDVNVNMKDREGATALHSAAVRGRPDSVRSLIDAGANVNARSDNGLSVLQSARHALDEAVKHDQAIQIHLLREVISHLEHAGAVQNPTSLLERGSGSP